MSLIIDAEEIFGKEYPIKPGDINLKTCLVGAFPYPVEISARIIISLCQDLGDWIPFTKRDIDEFVKIEFPFYNLICDGFIVLGNDLRYRVTSEFIEKCHKASNRG